MRSSIDPTPPPALDIDAVIAEMNALLPDAEERMLDFSLLMEEYYAVNVELAAQYPNRWIAFHCGQVIAVCDSHEGVLAAVDGLGIARRSVVFDFFERPRRRYVL